MPMLLYGNGMISGATSMPTNVQFGGTVGVTGALNTSSTFTTSGALTASNGIAFPATQAASSNPNTLDDYEEGTWTPAVYGSSNPGVYANLSGANGWYTKIGREIKASAFIIHGSTFTLSGAYVISGLPFTTSNYGGGGFISYFANWINQSPSLFQIEYNQTYGYLRARNKNDEANQYDLATSYFQNNTSYMLTILYMTT